MRRPAQAASRPPPKDGTNIERIPAPTRPAGRDNQDPATTVSGHSPRVLENSRMPPDGFRTLPPLFGKLGGGRGARYLTSITVSQMVRPLSLSRCDIGFAALDIGHDTATI